MKKPLKFYIAMPVEMNGPVVCHMFHWAMRAHQYLGPAVMDLAHSNDVAATRNVLVKNFLKSDCDVLWFVDSDMDPRLGSNNADVHGGTPYIKEAMERDDVDIVSGVTFRLGEMGPTLCLHDSQGKQHVHDNILKTRERGLVDGATLMTGGACIAVKRHVLEDFYDKKVLWFRDHLWDGTSPDEDPRKFGNLKMSEDYHFISEAKRLGHRFWVDTRVVWGHIKPRDIREELWTAEQLIREAQEKPSLLEVARA